MTAPATEMTAAGTASAAVAPAVAGGRQAPHACLVLGLAYLGGGLAVGPRLCP
jgi:hypothetical protein